MTIEIRNLRWAFNEGQQPVWEWQPPEPTKPSYQAVMGAWRSGKSTVVFRRFTKNQMNHSGMRSLIVRKTYVEHSDTTFPYVWNDPDNPDNWNKLGLIAKVKQDEMTIFTQNGGRVDFRSAIHGGREDPAKFGSISYGQILIEEAVEIGHKTFLTLMGRLSQKGMPLEMMLAFNPPTTRHWLHDEFVKNPRPQKSLFKLSMEHNRLYLPEGYIESLDHMPLSWRNAYINGDWGMIVEGDPVHPYYSEEQHVAPKMLLWDKQEPIIRCWDGHPTAVYFACVWMQLQKDGRLFIYRGKLWRNEGVRQLKKDAIRLSTLIFPGARFIDFGDPAMFVESKIELKSVADILYPEVKLEPGAVAFTERREAVDEWLLSQVSINGMLTQGFQICPNAETEMIREGLAGAYCLSKLDERYEKKDVPDKSEWSHMVEAMGYGITGLEIVRWRRLKDQDDSESRLEPVAAASGWMGI